MMPRFGSFLMMLPVMASLGPATLGCGSVRNSRKAREICPPDANWVWGHTTVIPPLGRVPQEGCELEVNLNCLREKERKGDGVEGGRIRKRKWKGKILEV